MLLTWLFHILLVLRLFFALDSKGAAAFFKKKKIKSSGCSNPNWSRCISVYIWYSVLLKNSTFFFLKECGETLQELNKGPVSAQGLLPIENADGNPSLCFCL